MNATPETIPIEQYIGIDSHKHYVMVGGMNAHREWSLRPRKVQMVRFRDWAVENLKAGDAVVLETTANVWDIISKQLLTICLQRMSIRPGFGQTLWMSGGLLTSCWDNFRSHAHRVRSGVWWTGNVSPPHPRFFSFCAIYIFQ